MVSVQEIALGVGVGALSIVLANYIMNQPTTAPQGQAKIAQQSQPSASSAMAPQSPGGPMIPLQSSVGTGGGSTQASIAPQSTSNLIATGTTISQGNQATIAMAPTSSGTAQATPVAGTNLYMVPVVGGPISVTPSQATLVNNMMPVAPILPINQTPTSAPPNAPAPFPLTLNGNFFVTKSYLSSDNRFFEWDAYFNDSTNNIQFGPFTLMAPVDYRNAVDVQQAIDSNMAVNTIVQTSLNQWMANANQLSQGGSSVGITATNYNIAIKNCYNTWISYIAQLNLYIKQRLTM